MKFCIHIKIYHCISDLFLCIEFLIFTGDFVDDGELFDELNLGDDKDEDKDVFA